MKQRLASLLLCVVAVGSVLAEPGRVKVTKATGSVIRTKGKIQTGSSSRIELELPYFAIARIGGNADFKFTPDAKKLSLGKGTMLLSVPNKTEGIEVESGSVITALTKGDLEMSNVDGQVKVIGLNGRITVSLAANPSDRRRLRDGQMVDVPAGATSMPSITAIKLSTLIKTSVLINMGPFPGLRAIKQNATSQAPPKPFVTGGFDPDWSGGGGAGSLFTSLGPAATAVMVTRLETNAIALSLPVLTPGTVPTQTQLTALEVAGAAIPSSNQRAIAAAGLIIIGGKLKPNPVPVPSLAAPQPTTRPVQLPQITPQPQPTPQPTRRPVIRPPIVRPTPRPPIAVP